jgi:hypothetical protein
MSVVSELDKDAIKSVLNIQDKSNQGAVVTFYSISDTRYTRKYTETLPSKTEWELNSFERVKETQQFYERIGKDIKEIKSDMYERKQSYLFHSFFTALNDLAVTEKKGPKVLAIVSDLGQNDKQLFSVYSKKDMALLKNSPEKLIEKIDNTYPLKGSIETIHIFFVHRTGIHNDQTYHLMLNFLTTYLQTKGCLHISAVGSMNEIIIPT